MKWSVIPALALLAPALHAQANPNVTAVRALYDMSASVLTKTAEQVGEDLYAFKPTPEVRSLGQILGHVANANFMFCSTALGEKSPATTDYEKVTSKAGIVQGLKDAFAYCDKVYHMADAKAEESAEIFGAKHNRLFVLIFNVAHNNEHYGNLVTYMRLKGITPPSSQRGGM